MFWNPASQSQRMSSKVSKLDSLVERDSKSHIQPHLQEKFIGDSVLEFSKKNTHKKLHRKHKKFVNSLTVSQDENSSQSFDQAKSAQHNREGNISQQISQNDIINFEQRGIPIEKIQLSKAILPSKFRHDKITDNNSKLINDLSSKTGTTNRPETRENSQCQGQKTEESLPFKVFEEQTRHNQPPFKVISIDESFQVSGIDENPHINSHNIILEESVINPISESLKGELQIYMNKVSSRSKSSQFQFTQRSKFRRMVEVPNKLCIDRANCKRIVFDQYSKYLMTEEIVFNYFSSNERYGDVYWAKVLGFHPTLRQLYGMDREGNNLKVYWEVLPSGQVTIKDLMKSKNLEVAVIPCLSRQILSFICHIRKFGLLHGALIPENIHCFKIFNHHQIKIKQLNSCSRFKQKEQKNQGKLSRFYPSLYDRTSFLMPDLIALCLIILEMYTGIESSCEQICSELLQSNKPSKWGALPNQAYDFMRSIGQMRGQQMGSLQSILTHSFVWEADSLSVQY